MKHLVIGLDAKRIVRNGTGLGSYGRTLVNDLAARADGDLLRLYAPDEGRDDLRRQVKITPDVRFCYPKGKLSALGKALWRSRGIVSDLVADGVDVFHGLSGELPTGLRCAGIKSVVTIHDLIFLRHPEWYNWIDTKIYAWKFRQTLREADRIIAISERTRQDIMELGGIGDDRIRLVYQSYAPRFAALPAGQALEAVRARYQLPERFVLNVGTIERRKNVKLAVEALALLPQDIHLVVVGRQTPYVKELPETPRVHLLSGVSDEELAAIYAMAEAFVYPSRYEGFGIPIIEAIAAGLPVVACTGSCLEEAGGPDSLYVDPDDVQGLAAALSAVLRGTEGREQRISRSQQYIARFRGTDVAGQVRAIYDEVLNTP